MGLFIVLMKRFCVYLIVWLFVCGGDDICYDGGDGVRRRDAKFGIEDVFVVFRRFGDGWVEWNFI